MNWGIVLIADIENIVIDDVTVKGMGGGVYTNPNSQGTIKNCNFVELSTGIGYDRASFSIERNSFSSISNIYIEIFVEQGEEFDEDELDAILTNNDFDSKVKVEIDDSFSGLKRYAITTQE